MTGTRGITSLNAVTTNTDGMEADTTIDSTPTDGTTVEGEVDRVDASRLVAACENAWRAIQEHHPDLPDTVIVLGSGIERGRLVKLGHWWSGQWVVDHGARSEVLIAGEALHLPASDVFQILLHEAAHGISAARSVKDTSRAGRYHNQRFKTIAQNVGLRVRRQDPYGWAHTELTPTTRLRYTEPIGVLADEMHLARTLPRNIHIGPDNDDHDHENDHGRDGDRGHDRDDGHGNGRSTASPPAMCGCGRRLRMAPSVLAQGPVVCGLCGQDFATDRQHAQTRDHGTAQDGHDRDSAEHGVELGAGHDDDRHSAEINDAEGFGPGRRDAETIDLRLIDLDLPDTRTITGEPELPWSSRAEGAGLEVSGW